MSIPHSPRHWLAACLAAVLPCVQAAGSDDAAMERQRLAQERSEVLARAKAAEADCSRRFVVTPCLEKVRSERRAALQQIDRQLAVLDDAQRKQRAAQRQQRIQQRQEDQARADEQRMAPDGQAQARPARSPASAPPAAARPHRTSDGAQRAAAAAREREDAAQRAAAAQRRAQQAEAHRAAVEERNRTKALKQPPQPTLPLPASTPSP